LNSCGRYASPVRVPTFALLSMITSPAESSAYEMSQSTVGRKTGQRLDARNVSIELEIALHDPLSGAGAAAAIFGNYSRVQQKGPAPETGGSAGQGLGALALGGD
jgi:hypothetical protein